MTKRKARQPKAGVLGIKGLTPERAEIIRAAYREAYLADNPGAKIEEFYFKYEALYAIS